MAPFRVVHSPGFDHDLETIGPQDERLDEVLEAVKDALSRNPLVGREVGSAGVRMIMGHPRNAMPIVFYYFFDGGPTVTLVGARQVRM